MDKKLKAKIDKISDRWELVFHNDTQLQLSPKWTELNEYIYDTAKELVMKIRIAEQERILRHMPDSALDELIKQARAEKKYRKDNPLIF